VDDKRGRIDLFQLISSASTVVAIITRRIAKRRNDLTMEEMMALRGRLVKPSKEFKSSVCSIGHDRMAEQKISDRLRWP
jgi:hypothetical protein